MPFNAPVFGGGNPVNLNLTGIRPTTTDWGPADVSKQVQDALGGLYKNYNSAFNESRTRGLNKLAGESWNKGVDAMKLGQPGGIYGSGGSNTIGGGGGSGTGGPAVTTPQDTYVKPLAPDIQNLVNTTSTKYGLSPTYLSKLIDIESSGNPNAVSATGATGLTQFTKGTWARYGTGDRRDPAANVDAAARLALDNKRQMENALGRPVTDGELYLAHQQGAAGAIALLKNPDARAGDVTNPRNIAVNGGDPNMKAGLFAQKWTGRFPGTAAAPQPAQPGTGGNQPTGRPGLPAGPASEIPAQPQLTYDEQVEYNRTHNLPPPVMPRGDPNVSPSEPVVQPGQPVVPPRAADPRADLPVASATPAARAAPRAGPGQFYIPGQDPRVPQRTAPQAAPGPADPQQAMLRPQAPLVPQGPLPGPTQRQGPDIARDDILREPDQVGEARMILADENQPIEMRVRASQIIHAYENATRGDRSPNNESYVFGPEQSDTYVRDTLNAGKRSTTNAYPGSPYRPGVDPASAGVYDSESLTPSNGAVGYSAPSGQSAGQMEPEQAFNPETGTNLPVGYNAPSAQSAGQLEPEQAFGPGEPRPVPPEDPKPPAPKPPGPTTPPRVADPPTTGTTGTPRAPTVDAGTARAASSLGINPAALEAASPDMLRALGYAIQAGDPGMVSAIASGINSVTASKNTKDKNAQTATVGDTLYERDANGNWNPVVKGNPKDKNAQTVTVGDTVYERDANGNWNPVVKGGVGGRPGTQVIGKDDAELRKKYNLPADGRAYQIKFDEKTGLPSDINPIAEERRDEDKSFTQENTLRNEFMKDPAVQKYIGAEQGLQALKTSFEQGNPVADQVAVMNIMKVLDPTSTVSAGEDATVKNAPGVPDQVRATYNRLMGSGGTFSAQTRADFYNVLRANVLAQKGYVDKAGDTVRNQATAYKLDPTRTLSYRSADFDKDLPAANEKTFEDKRKSEEEKKPPGPATPPDGSSIDRAIPALSIELGERLKAGTHYKLPDGRVIRSKGLNSGGQ
jgi:hypothetical protein